MNKLKCPKCGKVGLAISKATFTTPPFEVHHCPFCGWIESRRNERGPEPMILAEPPFNPSSRTGE